MRIEQLKLTHFRNLAPLNLAVSANTLVLLGDNAQGKTNVLEAVYLAATGRSFRGAAPAELIGEGHQEARAEALFMQRGVRHQVNLTWAPTANAQSVRQRLLLDGRGLRQASELLSLLQVVAFFPEDLAIAKAGPEARRRFVDRAVAGGRPKFVEAALAYHRALKARNALLRNVHTQDQAALVAAYDEALARHGACLHVTREQGLAELWPLARRAFAGLMPATELSWTWRSGFGDVPGRPLDGATSDSSPEFAAREEEVAAHLLALWRTTFHQDRARGLTLRGPHRGDLTALLDGRDVRQYASQGQQRCLVLSLKVAELQASAARMHSAPLLLLDDVSSELDRERLTRLFAYVAELNVQTWISSTGSVQLPLPQGRQVFRVRAGACTAVEEN